MERFSNLDLNSFTLRDRVINVVPNFAFKQIEQHNPAMLEVDGWGNPFGVDHLGEFHIARPPIVSSGTLYSKTRFENGIARFSLGWAPLDGNKISSMFELGYVCEGGGELLIGDAVIDLRNGVAGKASFLEVKNDKKTLNDWVKLEEGDELVVFAGPYAQYEREWLMGVLFK